MLLLLAHCQLRHALAQLRREEDLLDVAGPSQVLVDGYGRLPPVGDSLDDRGWPADDVAASEDARLLRGQGIGVGLQGVATARGKGEAGGEGRPAPQGAGNHL